MLTKCKHCMNFADVSNFWAKFGQFLPKSAQFYLWHLDVHSSLPRKDISVLSLKFNLKWCAKMYTKEHIMACQIGKNSKNTTLWRHNDVIIIWRIFWRQVTSLVIFINWWKFEVVSISRSTNMSSYILWWF